MKASDNGLPAGTPLRIKSHRALEKVTRLVAKLPEFYSTEDEHVWIATAEQWAQILAAKIKGVSKARPKPGATYGRTQSLR